MSCAAIIVLMMLPWSSNLTEARNAAEGDSSGTPHYYQPVEPGDPKLIQTDIAVYGGTPAGVTAAIQAARMGHQVVLLSFNQHVGGLTSGGLTATDVGKASTIGGIAGEFYDRIGTIKGFSPSSAESLFLKMLDEAGVRVLFKRALVSVSMQDSRLISATMDTGETIEASMFIDATYEGDLLAAANVSYHVGREPASAYGESLAGQWQKIAWPNVYQFCRLPLSPFVNPDDPQSGLLPEIASEPPGKPGEGDYKVQAYNFRVQMTNRPDRVPYPKPAQYDANRYDLLARFLNCDPNIQWTLDYTTKSMTDGPVQIRNGDSNNAGSFSSDYVGGNYRWPDGTYEPGSITQLPPPRRGLRMSLPELYELREQIFQDHLNYHQGLMYFLANDPRVPDSLQQRVNRFGLDPREFVNTGHWPHALYVREGRRMVADYVVTQADCQSKTVAEDSVGLGSYAMDSHFCQRVVVDENGEKVVRNEGGFGLPCPRPYPISYRSIVPREQECINLLVPVCLSASHVAYGSIRMEPVFMILGQSAGTAAAIAIDDDIPVQRVDYAKLAKRLIADGQVLHDQGDQVAAIQVKSLPGVVVDDTDAQFTGTWLSSSSVSPFVGRGYRHDDRGKQGDKSVTFTADLPAPGKYEVRVYFTAHANRASNIHTIIASNDDKNEVQLDQRRTDQGKPYASLGTFALGNAASVTLSNRHANGYVIADAVQFVPVK